MVAEKCEDLVGKSPTSDATIASNKGSKIFSDLVILRIDIPQH
jgi:hypothetical protein